MKDLFLLIVGGERLKAKSYDGKSLKQLNGAVHIQGFYPELSIFGTPLEVTSEVCVPCAF